MDKLEETITVIDLEQLVNGDDCKCESPTHDLGRVECSGDVAYLLRDCHGRTKICTNMGLRAIHYIAEGRVIHKSCGAPIRECWTIIPI